MDFFNNFLAPRNHDNENSKTNLENIQRFFLQENFDFLHFYLMFIAIEHFFEYSSSFSENVHFGFFYRHFFTIY